MTAQLVSRRSFIHAAGALGLSTLLGQTSGTASTAETPNKGLRFSAMVTLGDWAIFHGVWGEPGVYYILKRMRDAGFKRVYWRTTDGCGQTCFPSKVTNTAQQFIRDSKRFPEQKFIKDFLDEAKPADGPWLQGSVDFTHVDSVKLGIHWAKKFGLEFYAWHEHAEDHGGVGQPSRTSIEHPEWFTRNRDGKASRCRFSWGIKPAMDYRLALVREVMERQPDGLFFDFVKSMEGSPGLGCTPHWDDKGVWYCNYDQPIVEAFKKKTGRDPYQIPNDDEEWVRFRAGYATDFIRRVRTMQRSDFPKVKVGIFGCPSGRTGLSVSDKNIPVADPLRAYLEDHETWTKEGLLDEFVNAHTVFGKGVLLKDATRAMVADSRSRVHAPCKYKGTQVEVYSLKDEKALLAAVEAVAENNCEEIVFFETTPLEKNRTWEAAAKAVKQFGTG